MAIQKTGSGQVITEEGDPVRKTASVRPLTPQDVRDIEDEDTPED